MNNEKTKIFLLLLILNISCLNSAFSLPQNTSLRSLDSLKETIVALDVTRTKSAQKISQLNTMQDMSLKKDIREYHIFIEYLSYQIIHYCQKIRDQYGSQAIAGLPCIFQENYLQGVKSEIDDKELTTAEEQVSSLEDELMNSLGDFDEMLLKEEEHLAQVSRKQSSSSSSNQSKHSQAKNSSSSSANEQEAQDVQETQGSEENQENERSQETRAGKQQSGKYQKSQNSGSGQGKQNTSGKYKSRERRKLDEIDDDIVARQLKEAAEKETDPQLKEKLWDEYYRYKKNTIKK